MPEQAAIAAQVAALFDPPVGVGVTDPGAPQPALWPGEVLSGSAVVPKRQQEFAAGRAAARQAMAALGLAPVAIPSAPTRAPVWPVGLQGSISHSGSLCIAVVTIHGGPVGLDIEPATPMAADLMAEVLAPGEPVQDTVEARLRAKAVFSAKEAAFKAQFPVSGRFFGFKEMAITFAQTGDGFEAQFLGPQPPFAKGDKLLGRQAVVAGHFVSAVSLAAARSEE